MLARVASAMAARADLPLDRVSEAGLLADTVAAHAAACVADGYVGLSLAAAPGELVMRVGPLRRGGAAALLESSDLPHVGSVIARLADEVTLEEGDGAPEHLVLRLTSG